MADDIPYIAMEFVEGQTLDQLMLSYGRISHERVTLYASQLADALGFAHALGVVHRDVKPSNIIISRDGQVAKLLDFGVAHVVSTDSEAQLARTQAGQMIGTPRYMSPEQALGLTVDHRTDLFSLGAVLYEMIAGRPPFDAAGLATLAIQIAQEKPAALDRVAADCPAGLRHIVDKLLSKKPEHRFLDSAALVTALREERSTLANGQDLARRGLSIRIKLPLALVAITLIVMLATVSVISARQERALETMAATSGAMVTTFVSKNAAVRLADNAGLPSAEQDWAPLQAFVETASQDDGVHGIIVADASGIIRAATPRSRIGQRYARPTNESALASDTSSAVSVTSTAQFLRFVRPIHYAGATFGTIDVTIARAPLDAAVASARTLLIILGIVVVVAVTAVGYLSGALVTRPLGRLLRSIEGASRSRFASRISHSRADEIGHLYDAFNRMAAEVEDTLKDGAASKPPALEATQIAAPVRRAA
jgi:eukaryotic-like serine/threonine-protein kinase